jgi:hypothetical protein
MHEWVHGFSKRGGAGRRRGKMIHLGILLHGSVFMVATTVATCAGALLLKLWLRL